MNGILYINPVRPLIRQLFFNYSMDYEIAVRITKKLRQQIFEEENWKCAYCGKDIDESNGSIDHIVPLSRGGSDDRDNLTASCRQCNMQKADKIIEAFSNPIAKQAAAAWIHAYIKSPKVTIVASLIMVILSTFFAVYTDQQARRERDNKLSADLAFTSQIAKLNETEDSLKALLEFIRLQRSQMIESQGTINSLKEEKNKLAPLVDADRKVVEALFSAQEIRAQEAANSERWIGFVLGVGASIIASIILMIAQFLIGVRRGDS